MLCKATSFVPRKKILPTALGHSGVRHDLHHRVRLPVRREFLNANRISEHLFVNCVVLCAAKDARACSNEDPRMTINLNGR
jgi:hypothetical protein